MGEADTAPTIPAQTVSETATAAAVAPSMAIALPEKNPNPNPSWFRPKRLLAIFCVINMLNYLDRGAIASNGVNGSRGGCTEKGICTSGSGIQGDFDLNNFKDGVLSSAFMVGLLVASPIFASLAKSHNPFRLIGVGLLVWTIATAGCGCSFDFWSITICRMLVGVGEASFISLAAPFIDDNAPVAQRNAWLAIFYMCIPTGIAVGYVYGGLVGNHLHWRFAFWGESILMFPFAILGFVIQPLKLKGFASSESPEGKRYGKMTVPEVQDDHNSNIEISAGDAAKGDDAVPNKVFLFWKDMKALLMEKVYVINVLGYIAYNFVIGAYSYWGPKAGYDIYHMGNPDLLFGGITIICGIFGTLAGGYALDRMQSTSVVKGDTRRAIDAEGDAMRSLSPRPCEKDCGAHVDQVARASRDVVRTTRKSNRTPDSIGFFCFRKKSRKRKYRSISIYNTFRWISIYNGYQFFKFQQFP